MIDLQKEIDELKRKGRDNPPPLSKMAKITVTVLVQVASQNALELFRDKQFRKLTDFDGLAQIEQDRIFNELVLAYLTLLMLTFEAPDLRVDAPLKEYFISLREEIPKAYIDQLKDLRIEKKYLKDWEKLISMRYEEYAKDKLELRSTAMKIEEKEQSLTTGKLNEIQMLLPVQTVAIGCHHHVCRGKTREKNELFKVILRYLSKFYVEVRITAEGGNISFWNKLKVKIVGLFNI